MVTTNTSILIDWITPFSLEVTPTDTETGVISYCVEVYNSSTEEMLVSICNLIDTQYTYVPLDWYPTPCDSVNLIAIPVNSAGNGSSSHSTGVFYNGETIIQVYLSICLHVYASKSMVQTLLIEIISHILYSLQSFLLRLYSQNLTISNGYPGTARLILALSNSRNTLYSQL